jgi:hypothetical protein
MATYSFLDTSLSISGPGGSFNIGGAGTASAEEGWSVESAEANTMTIGAGGSAMHSMHADKSGKISVKLLKTSPVNRQLMNLYNFQKGNSSSWGQNVITGRDVARGDFLTGRETAFNKRPSLTYAKEGGMNEWTFDVGLLDTDLGNGQPAIG